MYTARASGTITSPGMSGSHSFSGAKLIRVKTFRPRQSPISTGPNHVFLRRVLYAKTHSVRSTTHSIVHPSEKDQNEAANIPTNPRPRSRKPTRRAFSRVISPEGKGRSGRSLQSSS